MTIDINCDLGEGFSHDADLMPLITSANIACGAHAGDETTIYKTIALCQEHAVAIGAHPGFEDRAHFGRIPQALSSAAVYDLVMRQITLLAEACEHLGARLHHVKPHGALYHMAATDASVSQQIVRAVHDFDPRLLFFGLSGSVMLEEAERVGLHPVHEVFADRRYEADGTLTPRQHPDALIANTEEACRQVLTMVREQYVMTRARQRLPLRADSVCLHGDGPEALHLARTVYRHLAQADISMAAIAHV